MKRILGFIFILISSYSKGQSAYDLHTVIPVSTVAPDAASLGKFGNIPVSYATGIPSVTIPLYEIKIGSIKIPLSLDYHGGGVRVDEVSSSVGTSWALNGISLISRSMIGMPDESSGYGYLSAPSLDSLYNFYYGKVYGKKTDSIFSLFMYNIRDHYTDTEPDIFSYTLNGSSGKFIYKQNGTIMQIPVTNNHIERISGNNFKITDENGMVYIFDQQESTNMVSASANGPGTYVSSWRLSKMIDANAADTISFKYTSVSGSSENSWNFSYLLGDKPNTSNPATRSDASGPSSAVSTMQHVIELFPNEIDWRGGKIIFKNAQDRTDRTSELRLDSVKVYSKLNGNFQLVKNIKLYQSYFYSNPIPGKTADYRNYRLRLDSVAFLPVNSGIAPQKYLLTYNNNPIAPNESFAQDMWGYNNGQYNNTSMMPKQTVLWKNNYYNIGDANMDPDSSNTYVEACMLQSIQYPARGKSVFVFEPHRYPLNYISTQQQSAICGVSGAYQTTNSKTFTVTSTQSGFTYSAYISPYQFTTGNPVVYNSGNNPYVQLVDQTTNTQIFNFQNNTTDKTKASSTGPNPLNLTVGHTYVLNVFINTNDSRVSASGTISWSIPVSGTLVKTGGGLRVSSITNYDNNGKFVNKETYQYGSNGSGTLLTDAVYLQVNNETVFYRIGAYEEEGYPCVPYYSDFGDVIYHAKSIYPATQFCGSPVVYGSVTKFDTDSVGNVNGKAVFGFTVSGDYAADAITDYGLLGVWLVSNPWKNGLPVTEDTYKTVGANYQPVTRKSFNYQVYHPDTTLGLKIKPLYINLGGCELYDDTTKTRAGALDQYNSNYVYFFEERVPAYTGAMLLQNESDTTFDAAGNKTVLVKNMYYDDLTHISPTRKEMFNSKGDDLVNVIKYPHDFAASGNVYQTMLNRNIIAPAVQYQEQKNGSQLTLTKINYNDWFGNGNLLLPQTVSEQILTNTAETRVNYNQFDIYGNILQQQKTNAPFMAYQWGYYKQYPVATAKNAKVNDIFYDGFEEGNGNSTLNDCKSGHYSHTGSYSKALTGLDAGTYTLSYWQKSGTTWSIVTSSVTVSGSTYTIGASPAISGQIDDVRFYPSNAQMTTFTYDPLIGMTSSTDAKNETTYYEYDSFQRLMNVKDMNGNIIKHTDYHY